MNRSPSYHFWQKFVSVCTTFTQLVVAGVVPSFFGMMTAFADVRDRHELVTLLVESSLLEESVNNEEAITGKIYRYANDIRTSLNDTKVIVLSVDEDEDAITIADTLEKLYFDGEVTDSEENHLTGVVLIGDVPLPQVTLSNGYAIDSMAPYTDFEDKAFIYNPKTNTYEEFQPDFQADVWHGIIPSFESEEVLANYFDELHSYYSGEKGTDRSVFYADFIDEAESLNSDKMQLYLNTVKYAEDIAYKRFTQKFLDLLNIDFQSQILPKLSEEDAYLQSIKEQRQSSNSCLWGSAPDKESIVNQASLGMLDDLQMPDIYTRLQIEKLLPEYGRIAEAYIQDIYSNVDQAGRWTQDDVNYFAKTITLHDIRMRETLRHAGDVMKEALINFVESSWQEPVYIEHDGKTYGQNPRTINSVEQCNWYKGSPESEGHFSQTVEYNATFNPRNTEKKDSGGCYIRNYSDPSECDPTDADKSVIDPLGATLSNGEAANYTHCRLSRNGEKDAHLVSSLSVHDEPRNETIERQIDAQYVPNLPVDGMPHIIFQNKNLQKQRIDLPNWFNAHGSSREFIQESIERLQSEGSTFDASIFESLFTDQFLDELDVWIAWKDFSISEKYHFAALTELFQVPENKTKGDISYIRGSIENGALILDMNPIDRDKKDLMQEMWENQRPSGTGSYNGDAEIPDGECGPYTGVSFFEWPGAVMCWLSSLGDFQFFDTKSFGQAWKDQWEQLEGELNAYTDSLESLGGDITDDSYEGLVADIEVPQQQTLIRSSEEQQKESNIPIMLYDDFGELYPGFAEIDIDLPRNVESTNTDINSTRDGLQIAAIHGKAELSVWTEANARGDIAFKVDGLRMETKLSTEDDLRLVASIQEKEIQDGWYLADMTLKTTENFFGEIPIFFSASTQVLFPNDIILKNGEVTFPIIFQGSENIIPYTISSPYISSQEFEIAPHDTLPAQFLIEKNEWYVDAGSELILNVQLADIFGRKVNGNKEFTLYITPASNEITDLRSQRITAENGIATIHIPANSIHGTMNFQLAGEGMESKLFTVHSVTKIEAEDIQNSASIFTFFAQEGQATAKDIMEAMLRSGSMAVAQKKPEFEEVSQRFVLNKDGSFILDDQTLFVEARKDLTFALVDTRTFEDIAIWELKNTEQELVPLVNNLFEIDGASVQFQGKEVLRTNANSVDLLDQRFTKNIVSDGQGIFVSIGFENTEVLQVRLANGTANLLTTLQTFQETEESYKLHWEEESDSFYPNGIGWKENDITILEAAARMSFADAFVDSQQVQDVFWGDPVLSFTLNPEEDIQSTGYDKTVGELLYEGDEDFEDVQLFDYNNDGIKDILLQSGFGTLELLEGQSSGNFIKRWDYGFNAKGISSMGTGDFAGDGFEDILVASNDGQIYFFSNREGHISPDLELFASDAREIKAMAVADFDGDEIKDIVLSTSRGEIVIHYGSPTGFQETAQIIRSFGIEITSDNAGEDLRITRENLATNQRVLFGSDQMIITAYQDFNEDNIPDLQLVLPSVATSQDLGEGYTMISGSQSSTIIANGTTDGYFRKDSTFVRHLSGAYFQSNAVNIPETIKLSDEDTRALGSITDAQKFYSSDDRNALDYHSLVDVNIAIPAGVTEEGEYLVDTLPSFFQLFQATATCNGESCPIQNQTDLQSNKIIIGPFENSDAQNIVYTIQVIQTPRIPFEYNALENSIDVPQLQKRYVTDETRKWQEITMVFPDPPLDNRTTPTSDQLSSTANNALKDSWGVGQSSRSGSSASFEESIKGTLEDAVSFLSSLNCLSGGCLAIPVNKAFLVPGMWSIAPTLLQAAAAGGTVGGLAQSVNDVLPRIGIPLAPNPAPTPVFGVNAGACPLFPIPCSGAACFLPPPCNTPASFRFYVSPTLTAGLGIAACVGTGNLPGLMAGALDITGTTATSLQASGQIGSCFAAGLPVSAVVPACDAINASLESVFDSVGNAKLFGSSRSIVQVDGGSSTPGIGSNFSGLALTINGFERFLDGDQINNSSTYPIGKSLLARWWDAQMSQLAKLLILPTITFYYPKMDAVLFGGTDDFGNEITEEQALIPRFQESLDDFSFNNNFENKKVDEKIEQGFQNVFDLMEDIPFLILDRQNIDIVVPWPDPKELSMMIAEIEGWLERNKAGWEQFKKDVETIKENCKNIADGNVGEGTIPNFDASLCDNQALFSFTADVTNFFSSIEANLRILEEYRQFPRELAKYKSQLAYYFADALHYINALIDVLGGWIERNKYIAEKYILLVLTIKELMNVWKDITAVFEGYMNTCNSCRVDVYSQNFSMFNLVLAILPTPPVIMFPRWPDIVIDMSHIQAGVLLEVPEINIHTRELHFFVNLEDIRFPDINNMNININISLPSLPLLPELPLLPDLPEFPNLPLPQLPDLPPPPKLPNFLDCLGAWLDIIALLLKLYCLISNGFWVYPESHLTNVIESLTNRPSNFKLPLDFLQLQWPDISYPWIDEIRVDGYLYVQPNIDVLSEPVRNVADEFNDLSNDIIYEGENLVQGTINKITNTLNQVFRGVNQQSDVFEDAIDDLERSIQEQGDDISNEIEDSLGYERGMMKDVSYWYDMLSEKDKRSVHIDTPSLRALEQSAQLVAQAFKQEASTALTLQETGSILAIADPEPVRDFVLAAENNLQMVTLSSQDRQQINSALQEASNAQTTETVLTDGLYLVDEETNEKQSLIDYRDLATVLSSMVLEDFDNDGDKDLFYTAKNKLFLKTSYETLSEIQFGKAYEDAIETFTLDEFIPEKRSVNNVETTSANGAVNISWLEDTSNDNAGYVLERKMLVSGFDVHHETVSDYIFLLKPSLINESNKDLKNLEGRASLRLGEKSYDIRKNETALVQPFVSASYNWQMENDFYYLRVYALKNDGSISTSSRQVLLAPQKGADERAPVLTAITPARVPVLKEWPLVADAVYDQSPIEYIWDFDKNGSVDAEGVDVLYPAQEALGEQTIDLIIRDSANNLLSLEKNVEVFSPEIFIDDMNENLIRGHIEPAIPYMPFAFLRERNEALQLITPEEENRYFTDVYGNFLIQRDTEKSGYLVRGDNDETIAFVDTNTGMIDLEDNNYLLQAKAATENSPTQLIISSSNNEHIAIIDYRTQSENLEVIDTNNNDGVDIIAIPKTAKFFAGASALTAEDGTIFAAVSQNGSIRLLVNTWSLAFEQSSGRAEFIILNADQEEVARVQFGSLESDLFSFFLQTAHAKEDVIFTEDPDLIATEKEEKDLEIPFTDLNPSHPAYSAIIDLYERNILKGYDDGSFHPDAKISRAEFVKVALGATTCFDCSSPTEETKEQFQVTKPFPDVNLTDWFYYCISIAKKESMVTGYGDGQFHPNKNITRKEAAAVLLRQAEIELTEMPENYFNDVPEYDWAKDYVYTAVQLGIIQNIGGFTNPNQEISRGEFAMMASRILSINACKIRPEYQDTHDFTTGKLPDEVVTELPDGGTVTENPDGSVTVEDPDGNVTNVPSSGFAGICPEFKGGLCPWLPETFDIPDQIIARPASSETECVFVDDLQELIPNDKLSAIIIGNDNRTIFSQSNIMEIAQ